MMRTGPICVGVILAFVLMSRAQNDDPVKRIQSADAKKALAEFDKVLQQARETLDKSTEVARKKLVADLAVAQEKAAKANELDEAVLLRDIRKRYEEGILPDPKDRNLQVVSAFYGQNISWLDVTEKARRATKGKAKWSTIVNTKDWGEPAPGFAGPRTLMIRYTIGDRVLFKAVYQGQEMSLP